MLGVAGVERWRILDRRMGLGHAEHEEEGSIVGARLWPIHGFLHIQLGRIAFLHGDSRLR